MLNIALKPVAYEEATKQLARFLQHYPRRYIEQDAVVIQDIADELVIRKLGFVAVLEGLRELRNKANPDNPWVPQTGIILDKIHDYQNFYRDHLKRLTEKPKELLPSPEEKQRLTWNDMDENQRNSALELLKTTSKELGDIYRKALEIPKEIIIEERE